MEYRDAATRFRRLLLPVGGKIPGAAVLSRAEPLLDRPGANVTVLTVIEAGGARANSPEFRADPRHHELINQVEILRQRLAARGILAETQVRFGDPAQEIVREAEKTDRDLIIMGTRGRTELKRLFLGSVAPAVLQRARIPLLLFPTSAKAEEPPGHAPFRRIFVSLDGTKMSERILPPVLALARDFDSEICLSMTVLSPARARDLRRAKAYLNATLPAITGAGFKTRTEILSGDPGAQAIAAAERGYDAIAMASHARTPLGAALWGSETAHVLSTVSVPVLTVAGRRVGATAPVPKALAPE